MTKPVFLRTMGGAGLETPAGTAVSARKHIALMAYLALQPPHAAPRERLAGLIWEDADGPRAKASLRQALSELRADPAIGAALKVDRANVALDPEAIRSDLDDALSDLGQGRLSRTLRLGPDLSDNLLYGYESIGEGFADWLTTLRAAQHARIVEALGAAAASEALPLETRQALADAAFAVEPLSEHACRTVMRLAGQDSNVGHALAAYAALCTSLDEAFGMEPSDETQDLAVDVKLGRLAPEPPPPSAPARPAAAPSDAHGEPILAVLPPRVIGPEEVASHLAEMLVDDVVMKLARLPELTVLSTSSTRPIADEADAIGLLAQRFGVDYVLTGTVRRMGADYRITPELLRVEDGAVLWRDAFSSAEDDLLDAQAAIAERLVRTLLPHVHRTELLTCADYAIENLTSYQQLLRAQSLIYGLTPDPFAQAGDMLRIAVARAPEFVPARVALADWHSLRVGQGWSDDPATDRNDLEEHLRHVLRSGQRNGRALAMLGHNRAIYARAYDEAIALFDEAVETMPGDAETLLWTGPTLCYVGRAGDAEARMRRVKALAPNDPLAFRIEHFLSLALYAQGEMEEAAAVGLVSMQRNPRYTSNLRITAAALVAQGRLDEARDVARWVPSIEPGFGVAEFVRRQAFRDPALRAELGDRLRLAGLPN